MGILWNPNIEVRVRRENMNECQDGNDDDGKSQFGKREHADQKKKLKKEKRREKEGRNGQDRFLKPSWKKEIRNSDRVNWQKEIQHRLIK